MINQRLAKAFQLAIKAYIVGLKEKKENIKPFRQQDLDYLLNLINSAKTTECLYSLTKDYLSKIKTGFWIFKTGRSRLKRNFMAIYDDPSYSLTKLLLEDIEYLKSSIARIPAKEKAECFSDMHSLREKVIDLTTELERTKTRCKTLENDNKLLKTLNDNFSELNQEIMAQLGKTDAEQKIRPSPSINSSSLSI